MFDTFKLTRTFETVQAPLKIVESIHAMAPPKAQPFTDDMRAMVDHFQSLGQIRMKPCAYQMGSTMIVHPSFMREIRKHTANVLDDWREKAFANLIFGGR